MALTATGRGRKPAVPSIEDAAKADYLYLEALRAKSQGELRCSLFAPVTG